MNTQKNKEAINEYFKMTSRDINSEKELQIKTNFKKILEKEFVCFEIKPDDLVELKKIASEFNIPCKLVKKHYDHLLNLVIPTVAFIVIGGLGLSSLDLHKNMNENISKSLYVIICHLIVAVPILVQAISSVRRISLKDYVEVDSEKWNLSTIIKKKL